MNRKTFALTLVGAALAVAAGSLAAQDKPIIATVVKISGIPWFNRMEVGVKQFQADTPTVIASQSGPSTSDAAERTASSPTWWRARCRRSRWCRWIRR